MARLDLRLGINLTRQDLLSVDAATLDLDFTQERYSMGLINKPFGDIISFTRASAATRFNASGALETVGNNVPRIEHDPDTFLRRGIFIEDQRTNLLLNSTTLATQSVSVTGLTKTLSFTGTGSIALSGAHTATLAGTGVNNRVSLTFTPSAGTLTLTVTGDVRRAQLEIGAFRTSWIPTAASQVTRSAESVRINTLSPWYHGSLGTIFAELQYPAEGGGAVSNAIFSLDDGSNNNRLTLRKLQSSLSTNFLLVAAGSILVNNSLSPGSLSAATVRKVAVSFSGSSYSVAVNGNILTFPGTAGVPAATRLVIGGGAGSSEACAIMRKIKYIRKVLSNTELQALTA